MHHPFRHWKPGSVSLSLFTGLVGMASMFAQSAPAYNQLYQAVIARHGGPALNVRNTQVSGSIAYRGETASSFSLTLQSIFTRLEVNKPNGAMIVVRRGQRSQATKGTTRDPVERTPLSSSGANLLPIFALSNFHNDPHFERAVVLGPDGLIGLQYVEGSPPGFAPPPFAQSRLIATFWLDGNNRIVQASYADDKRSTLPVDYRYFYSGAVSTPFLRPDRVEAIVGKQPVYTAELGTARVDVPLPPDFFDITR